jgi:hypothetical protein
MENGGTEDAPWGDGPSLLNSILNLVAKLDPKFKMAF